MGAIAQKEVTLFPEERFCVLGILRHQGFLETDTAALKLIQSLTEQLESPIQIWVLVINREGFWHLQTRFDELEGALIFREQQQLGALGMDWKLPEPQ
jgi:hypothetical protein